MVWLVSVAVAPGRQDVLGQFSMVSMELFNIVEDINKVNKGFVVYPKNVNAENAASTRCSSGISLLVQHIDVLVTQWNFS